jgi:hypothetical protein
MHTPLLPAHCDDMAQYEDRHAELWCVGCTKWVVPVLRDHGIGGFEYWGSKEVHHDWRTECRECDGSEFLEYEPDATEE